jgi:hypothetical protein
VRDLGTYTLTSIIEYTAGLQTLTLEMPVFCEIYFFFLIKTNKGNKGN